MTVQTHDVIKLKKGLKSCSADECHGKHSGCPYTSSALCMTDMANDAMEYITQLEKRLASVGKTCQEWISVKDRLPKNGQIVFCYTKYFYEVLQWDDDSEQWFGQNSVNAKHYVTHWMLLPEPPKED